MRTLPVTMVAASAIRPALASEHQLRRGLKNNHPRRGAVRNLDERSAARAITDSAKAMSCSGRSRLYFCVGDPTIPREPLRWQKAVTQLGGEWLTPQRSKRHCRGLPKTWGDHGGRKKQSDAGGRNSVCGFVEIDWKFGRSPRVSSLPSRTHSQNPREKFRRHYTIQYGCPDRCKCAENRNLRFRRE